MPMRPPRSKSSLTNRTKRVIGKSPLVTAADGFGAIARICAPVGHLSPADDIARKTIADPANGFDGRGVISQLLT